MSSVLKKADKLNLSLSLSLDMHTVQGYERNLHQWKLRVCKMHIGNITSTGALAASVTRASADVLQTRSKLMHCAPDM